MTVQLINIPFTKVDFDFDTQYGKYGDALYLPEGHSFTEEQIAAMKQERLNNWLLFIENTPEPEPEPEPGPEV